MEAVEVLVVELAVIVTDCPEAGASGAVQMTVEFGPDGDKVPAEAVQLAVPPENVRLTSSPTPTVRR